MLKDIRQQITEEDRCIYIFELTDSSASGKLCSNLKRAKENNPKSFAAPKINTANASSGCVYVGSSFATGQRRNTLATRLKQHLGLSNATTYAMHLQRWARDVPGGIKITAWQYPLGVNRSMILAIEDALSEHRQPILGKRGSAR